MQVYHTKLRKVPIPDMTAVLSVRSATRSKPVRQNQFVRLRRKPYKDDLAKVVEVRAKRTHGMFNGVTGEGRGERGEGRGERQNGKKAEARVKPSDWD